MSNNEIRIFKIKEDLNWRPVGVPVDDVLPEAFGELTDLEFAAAHGRIGIIRVLLEAGADVNANSQSRESTPLMAAAGNGQAEAVQFLINSGADLEAKDSPGRTCLFRAVESGDKKTVQVLIDSGADVNVSDDWGVTPLICAAVGNSIELVKILLAAGADVNATDKNGKTALDHVRHKRYRIPLLGYFYTSKRNQEIVRLLEQAKLKSGV